MVEQRYDAVLAVIREGRTILARAIPYLLPTYGVCPISWADEAGSANALHADERSTWLEAPAHRVSRIERRAARFGGRIFR